MLMSSTDDIFLLVHKETVRQIFVQQKYFKTKLWEIKI